jgi:hypothetical protein
VGVVLLHVFGVTRADYSGLAYVVAIKAVARLLPIFLVCERSSDQVFA